MDTFVGLSCDIVNYEGVVFYKFFWDWCDIM